MKNLIEETLDRLKSEIYKLEEMSKSKSAIERLLDDKTPIILDHLIYCYLWSNSQDYSKWKGEVRGFLYELPRWSNGNKFLDFETLNEWYLEDRLERIDDHIKDYVINACYAEKKKVPKYSTNKIKDYLKEYLIWFCENISDGKILNRADVENKIDELIIKYK